MAEPAPFTLTPLIDATTAPAPHAWYMLPSDGTPPGPRIGHSVATLGSLVVAFGGADETGVHNDIHIFDFSEGG